jgi:hypothetical protein
MDKPLLQDNINPTLRLSLRTGIEVAITGLPVDLTRDEADRLIAVIVAAGGYKEPAK